MTISKTLEIIQFGDPLLRKKVKLVQHKEIESKIFQNFITSMYQTLSEKKLGVGLAAPQVGVNKSVIIINIEPMPHRPNVEALKIVLINPKIIETFGKKIPLWEGCISSGLKENGLFALVPRFQKIKIEYLNENTKKQTITLRNLSAHVVQHEIDHLNGVLFVDKVEDTKSYMTYSEYLKRIVHKHKTKK